MSVVLLFDLTAVRWGGEGGVKPSDEGPSDRVAKNPKTTISVIFRQMSALIFRQNSALIFRQISALIFRHKYHSQYSNLSVSMPAALGDPHFFDICNVDLMVSQRFNKEHDNYQNQ